MTGAISSNNPILFALSNTPSVPVTCSPKNLAVFLAALSSMITKSEVGVS